MSRLTYTEVVNSNFKPALVHQYMSEEWGTILAHGGLNGLYSKARKMAKRMAKQLNVEEAVIIVEAIKGK